MVEDKQKRRPIRCIKVEKCEFQVLVDTGATVNVMDECTFSTVTGWQGHTESISSVLRAFQTDKSPMVSLKVIGKFSVMVESGKRMALATFHVTKGAQTLTVDRVPGCQRSRSCAGCKFDSIE